MAFEYDDLAQPDCEIRVAVLEPGSFNDPIVVHFVSRVLTDAKPTYQALSYVWGSKDHPSHITISSPRHSGTVAITQNLDSALRHLRNGTKPRFLWIDALCINQENIQEKDAQVMAMGKIFQTALDVIAWLGPEENNSNKTIARLKNLARKIDVNWSIEDVTVRTRRGTQKLPRKAELERQQILDMIRGMKLPWEAEEIHSLYLLITRPYFRRAWVIQEIRLARRVLLQCGYAKIPENSFWKAACLLQRSSTPLKPAIGPEEWTRVFQQLMVLTKLRAKQSYINICNLRSNYGHLECNDARDKLYCFLGIFDVPSQNLHIVPTYLESTESVYTHVTRRMYTKTSNLNLLEDCLLAARVLNLPSWVPDWSTPTYSSILWFRWSACAWIAIEPRFDESGLRCTVPGVPVGEVVQVGALNSGLYTWADLWDFLRALRPSADTLDSVYITGETLLVAYCRLLVADNLRHSGRTGNLDMPVFEESLELLKMLWSEDYSETALGETLRKSNVYFRNIYTLFWNRRLFKTSSGYLGLAPAEAQTGDILCVLLGCRVPMILRPKQDNTYLVVGHCYAHGIMHGEIIYQNAYAIERKLRIVESNGYPDLVGPGKEDFWYEADEMLEGAGVRVEGRREEPKSYFVSLENLKEVGVAVQEFVLV